MSDDPEISTANTMRERAGESRLKLWLLLRADRLLVAVVLVAAVFLAFVVAVVLLSPPFVRQLATGSPIEWIFSTMVSVIVTGTTLVVTIGQLVISQENGPLGDQRQRMSNTMDVRESTERLIGSPSPADPSAFLRELVGATADRARALDESVARGGDADLRREVDEFTESIVTNADEVRDQLDGARFGTFDVLFAALNFNYSWKVFQVERIADKHEGSLDDDDRSRLRELKTALSLFGPVREHIKTLYFQWVLIDLSRQILYASIPAVIVAAVMIAVVDAGTVPGSTLGIDHVVLVVGAAFAVTLLPFLLLVSYLLRVLTAAKRTLAIGPLILRDSQR